MASGLCLVAPVRAQITAFSYSGQMADGGAPANGTYVFRFTVYNAANNGDTVGAPITTSLVEVSNGLFTLTLDFGDGVFTGANRWLGIEVHTNANGAMFVALSPFQPILPTPYAITASHVSGPVPASQLVGTLPSASQARRWPAAITPSPMVSGRSMPCKLRVGHRCVSS